jgi:hypothetical protein
MDYIIGLLMFIGMLLISVNMMLSMSNKDNYEPVYREAIHISDILMSDGVPNNWNSTTVITPGLLRIDSESRINNTKLASFNSIGYARTKTLFRSDHEYLFFFRNSTRIINMSSCIYGYPISVDENCTPMLTSLNYNNLAKIERVVIINSTVVTMVIYTWD